MASSSVRKIEGHLVSHQAVREEGAAGSGWSRSIWRKRKWKNPSQTAAVHVLSDSHITSIDFHLDQAAGRAVQEGQVDGHGEECYALCKDKVTF
jgi:hypothetical protein